MDAIESGSDSCPAAMLLDVTLPKVDGFEVLARFRASAAARDLPIFLFSGRPVELMMHAAASRNIQTDGYFGEPFDLALATELRACARGRVRGQWQRPKG